MSKQEHPDDPTSLVSSCQRSLKRVEEESFAAWQLLSLLAFLPSNAIPEELFTMHMEFFDPDICPFATDDSAFQQAVNLLSAHALIYYDATAKILSLQPLTQTLVLDSLSPEARRSWAGLVVSLVRVAFPDDHEPAWLDGEHVLPLGFTATSLIDEYKFTDRDAAGLLLELAICLCKRERYKESEQICRQLLRIREYTDRNEYPVLAQCLNQLAIVLFNLNRYEDVEQLFLRSLQCYEQQYGSASYPVATTLDQLAGLYRKQGRCEEAEPLYRRALRIMIPLVGTENYSVATVSARLALLCTQLGKYEEAEQLLLDVLQLAEDSRCPLMLPRILRALGDLYTAQGRDQEAKPLYLRASQFPTLTPRPYKGQPVD